MEEDDRYDEFGNLIDGGSDSASDSDSNPLAAALQQNLSDISDTEGEQVQNRSLVTQTTKDASIETNQLSTVADTTKAMTLSQRFGPDVETIVPHQPARDEPVIAANIERRGKIEVKEGSLPATVYSKEYMVNIARDVPERIRNVAVVGGFHSGKTSLVDMLVQATHTPGEEEETGAGKVVPSKYTDNHVLEMKRGMSIKTNVMSVLLPDTKGKSHIFNILDSPGHIGFQDETTVALEACEGVLLVIDAVEGAGFRDWLLIDDILSRNLPMTVIINKIDRLILETKLPPADTYFKLSHMIHDLNKYIKSHKLFSKYTHQAFSPAQNVFFASSQLQFCFSTQTFAQLYYAAHGLEVDESEPFARKLWGQNFYDVKSHKIVNNSKQGQYPRTFVHFILEPIYKIVTYTITRDNNKSEVLKSLLQDNFGIKLTSQDLADNSETLLADIFLKIFPVSDTFSQAVLSTVPPPLSSHLHNEVSTPPSEKTIVKVVKLVESSNGDFFYCLVKILSGCLRQGQQVYAADHYYNQDNNGPQSIPLETIQELYVSGARYKIPVSELTAGTIGLVKGISTITKYGLLVDQQFGDNDLQSVCQQHLKSLQFDSGSVLKVAVEAKNSMDQTRLEQSLHKVMKSYLSCTLLTTTAGEYQVCGTSEIQLDCILHDVRYFYADNLELNVSQPMVKFAEAVSERSITRISANAAGALMSIICEPMSNTNLAQAITNGEVDQPPLEPSKPYSKLLRTQYDVDSLESRNIWSFTDVSINAVPGVIKGQPCVLLDDTLEGTTDHIPPSVKQAIISGFQWACSEGPLCDEAIKGTTFKILDLQLEDPNISSAQLIPLARKCCYTGFLTAFPKLLEPIYRVHVICTVKVAAFIDGLIGKRRGHTTSHAEIPGTNLVNIEGEIPVIDSIGFETDLRLATQGQAMSYVYFHRYEEVPGNPLDKDVFLPELKPVPVESMARDFVLKTRRRQGITGEPSVQKYIEPELYNKLQSIGLG